MNKSLVVGMGIGQLYKTVLENLGNTVITVDQDPSKNAMFTTVDQAIIVHGPFQTSHICTPNFTHFKLATRVAAHSDIVFIEKPGVSNSFTWKQLLESFPTTRFMMVKNNMWRNNINELKDVAAKAKHVMIEWSRKNCVPSPGSWFTTRDLAFGGVSRDLMPHLLSLYVALNPNWRTDRISGQASIQNWQLSDITSTDYGTVNSNGTYNVDDLCNFKFSHKWECLANWRNMDTDKSAIDFLMQDNSTTTFELGWCPEDAYQSMIQDAINNIDNYQFWLYQFEIDSWIHERIENL